MLGMQEDKESENFFSYFSFFFNDKVTYRMPTESEDEGGVLEAQAIWRV